MIRRPVPSHPRPTFGKTSGVRTVLLPLLSFFLLCLSAYVIVPLIPLFVQSRFGASTVDAAWITVGASTFGVIPSALVGGWLADRIGSRITMAAALLVFGVSKFLFPFAHSLALLFLLRAIGGVYAMAFPATQSMLLRDTGNPQERMRHLSYYGAAFGGGLTLGPLLGGVVARWGGLDQAFNLTFDLCLLGALLVLLAREERPARQTAAPGVLAFSCDRVFWQAATMALLVMGSLGTLLTVVPMQERSHAHLSTAGIGVSVALLTGSFALSPLLLAGRLEKHPLRGLRWGMAFTLAGEVAAAVGGGEGWGLWAGLLLSGCGLGITQLVAAARAAGTVSEGNRGAVMGLFTVAMNIGYGLLAVLVVFLGSRWGGQGPLWILPALSLPALLALLLPNRARDETAAEGD